MHGHGVNRVLQPALHVDARPLDVGGRTPIAPAQTHGERELLGELIQLAAGGGSSQRSSPASRVSAARSGSRRTVRPDAAAARNSARAVIDFDPGRRTSVIRCPLPSRVMVLPTTLGQREAGPGLPQEPASYIVAVKQLFRDLS